MSLNPSVRQALEVAEGCGLCTLQEAVDNYLNHYTMFFLIEKYSEQYKAFVDELKSLGFLSDNTLKEISVADALIVCDNVGESDAQKSN